MKPILSRPSSPKSKSPRAGSEKTAVMVPPHPTPRAKSDIIRNGILRNKIYWGDLYASMAAILLLSRSFYPLRPASKSRGNTKCWPRGIWRPTRRPARSREENSTKHTSTFSLGMIVFGECVYPMIFPTILFTVFQALFKPHQFIPTNVVIKEFHI